MWPGLGVGEAISTTPIHRVAGLTGDRTALVTTLSFRAPNHTISDAGLIGGGHVPRPGEVSLAQTACSFWMNCRSAAAMSSRSCGNRSRIVSQEYDLPHVIDLAALTVLAARVLHKAFTPPNRIHMVQHTHSEEQRSLYPRWTSTLHGAEPSGGRPCPWGRQTSAPRTKPLAAGRRAQAGRLHSGLH
jgi:hypothetical protein